MALTDRAKLVRALSSLLLIAAVALLPACGAAEPEQTATAAYERARADIEDLRGTATVARARMKTTLEYAVTRVAQAQEAAEFLRFNLINLGFASDDIETSVSQMRQTAPAGTATRSAQDAISLVTPMTPPPAAKVSQPPPTATQAGPRLADMVMATGVRDDDCARDVNPRFTPASSEIYIVARAYNIPAGAAISSSWQRRGAEVAHFSFQPDFDINGECIWFFIDQTDTPFVAGAWSVEIRVDDQSVASPIAFQIVEN